MSAQLKSYATQKLCKPPSYTEKIHRTIEFRLAHDTIAILTYILALCNKVHGVGRSTRPYMYLFRQYLLSFKKRFRHLLYATTYRFTQV